MDGKKSVKLFLKDNWLFLLIVLQPVLDVLAYWTQGGDATFAGYIRLVIMLALPLHLLITLKKKRNFIIAMAAIGICCLLHIANGFRVGYISMFFDIAYTARIAQMPILAVCFVYYIRDEQMEKQALDGVLCSAVITVVLVAAAVISGTYTPTYPEGIGISGWVIDDNRCANSILFVTLATFSVYFGWRSKNVVINLIIPVLVAFILLINGTMACYMGLFAIMGGYAVFMIAAKFIKGEKFKKAFVAVLALIFVTAVLIYPITPRAAISAKEAEAANKLKNELEITLAELGYDVSGMSFEEKYNNPEIRAVFEDFYSRMIYYVIPEMFDEFGMEKVLRKYDMTTDAEKIIDVRVMKLSYASLIWDECDTLTKLVGFETTRACGDGSNDMENDWHAVFYYTGYIGFTAYVGFALYFVYIIIRRLLKDFKGSLTVYNFCLLAAFALLLGLAHFSGAALRRPNVSIYISLIMALIYYQTRIIPIEKLEKEPEA